MALPQDISAVSSDVMDSIARSTKMDWIEYKDGTGFMKILWFGAETGHWAVLLKWLKGHVAPRHKHLSTAHTYILSGKIQVRNEVLDAGDYLYEANGMVHDATVALEDTIYLFICKGPILYFNDDGFTGYLGWEQIKRMADSN
jgi:anti-sigma factor ChrR (cupin superfamily)